MKREGLSGPLPSSSTNPQGTNDEISRAEQILAAKTQAEKRETIGIISLEHTLDSHKDEKVKQARILTGQLRLSDTGDVIVPSDSSGGASKESSYSTAAVLGALTIIINFAWTAYVGTNMDEQLKLSIAVLLQAGAHALATYLNNRTPKGA